MDRQTLVYGIIAFVALAIAALVLYRRHHSYERAYRRRNRREKAAYDELMADQAAPRDEQPEG
jgi:hypothetical protein